MSDPNERDPAIKMLEGAEVSPPPDFRSSVLDAAQAEGAITAPAPTHQLAQMNTARFRHPMDHPDMAGFVEMLDPMNHQADVAEGFVWRLTDEDSNDATSITYYDDPLLLVNISVWSDLDSLRNYVYRSAHVHMVKRRDEWADAMAEAHVVLWWVPTGHRPDVAEGDAKLGLLRSEGPTPKAFTFARHFPPPIGDQPVLP